jgi:hypothetical protein
VWHQDGATLVGSDYEGQSHQGFFAISGDATTVAVGAFFDDDHRGAAFIFHRDFSGVWKQRTLVEFGSNKQRTLVEFGSNKVPN